jgi:hypothetical protein
MVKPSGGWWVLEGDTQWNSHPYDFHTQMRKVHTDYWTDVFFTFNVVTDWLDWNKNVIQVRIETGVFV